MLSEPNFPMWCVVEFVLFDLLLKTWPWQSLLKRTCFNSWKTKLCSNSEKCPDTGLKFFSQFNVGCDDCDIVVMGFNWLGGKTQFLFSPLFWMYIFCFHKFIQQKLCFRRSQLLFMSLSTLWYVLSLEPISKNMVRDGVWRHAMLRGMERSAALCAVWRWKVGRQAVDSILQSPHHFEIGRSTVGCRSSF